MCITIHLQCIIVLQSVLMHETSYAHVATREKYCIATCCAKTQRQSVSPIKIGKLEATPPGAQRYWVNAKAVCVCTL